MSIVSSVATPSVVLPIPHTFASAGADLSATFTSPYSAEAGEYIAHGLPALPVAPGTKVPGYCSFGEWRPMSGWQDYANQMPTGIQVDIWSDWPNAGLCVPMGGISKILAIDVDTDRPEIKEAIATELGELLVARRRGARGYAAFVRIPEGWTEPAHETDPAKQQTKWNVDGQRVLDLLGTGRQVVMPPSVHPGTQQPYVWLTNTTILNADELPPCPPDIVERISRALGPFQSADDKHKETALSESAGMRAGRGEGEQTEGQKVNSAALAQLSGWVPDLIPADFLQKSSAGFRAKPFWRGVTDDFKCSIHPSGIRDFAEDLGLTPIDLVIRVTGNTAREAMEWLAPRVGVELEKHYTSAELQEWAKELLASPPPLIAEAAHTSAIEPPRPTAKPHVLRAEGLPPELHTPPGMLGEIMRWMLATSRLPQPELCLQAALAFGSLVMGRIYKGPTALRSNMMLVGIARTGFGKMHPQSCLIRLINDCGLEAQLGGSGIASGSAILSQLAATGAYTIYSIDEFDSVLAAAAQKHAPAHLTEVVSILMQLYSHSVNPLFKGKDFSDKKLKKTEALSYPHLTLLGFTTPDKFYECIKGKDVASGLLNRFIVAEAPEKRPVEVRLPQDLDRTPESIVQWAAMVRRADFAVDPNSSTSFGATADSPVVVPFVNDRAELLMDAFKAEVQEMSDSLHSEGAGADDVVARWVENAYKVAMICGGAKYPDRPRIDEECVTWATGYVRHCGNLLLEGVKGRMFESEFDARVQTVRQFVTKRGERGASHRDLHKGCRTWAGMQPALRKDVVSTLLEAGMIERRLNQKGNPVYVAVGAEDD